MDASERLRQLEAVCLEDMASLSGVRGNRVAAAAVCGLFGARARRFARDMARFNAEVGQRGVAIASRRMAARYGAEVKVRCPEHVPVDGPTLVVANHPGLMDAIAIYATLGRGDVRALSRPQPLLALLDNMDRHLLFVPDEGPGRPRSVRWLLEHLKDGGAAILFPAGHLEPEPTFPRDRPDPLGDWSAGLGVLARLAVRHGIALSIVPTAVGGVLAESIRRRFWPLIRLRKTLQGRADLTAALQLAFPRLASTTVWVRYAEPLDTRSLVAAHPDPTAFTERVRDIVRQLLES